VATGRIDEEITSSSRGSLPIATMVLPSPDHSTV
jgi:hypothetical protein